MVICMRKFIFYLRYVFLVNKEKCEVEECFIQFETSSTCLVWEVYHCYRISFYFCSDHDSTSVAKTTSKGCILISLYVDDMSIRGDEVDEIGDLKLISKTV